MARATTRIITVRQPGLPSRLDRRGVCAVFADSGGTAAARGNCSPPRQRGPLCRCSPGRGGGQPAASPGTCDTRATRRGLRELCAALIAWPAGGVSACGCLSVTASDGTTASRPSTWRPPPPEPSQTPDPLPVEACYFLPHGPAGVRAPVGRWRCVRSLVVARAGSGRALFPRRPGLRVFTVSTVAGQLAYLLVPPPPNTTPLCSAPIICSGICPARARVHFRAGLRRLNCPARGRCYSLLSLCHLSQLVMICRSRSIMIYSAARLALRRTFACWCSCPHASCFPGGTLTNLCLSARTNGAVLSVQERRVERRKRPARQLREPLTCGGGAPDRLLGPAAAAAAAYTRWVAAPRSPAAWACAR
jgi:hypothetical protein